MASREDAMFDENKYYFPQGAAKVRDERIQQPWLEVSTERDEQGTPGLQLVPDEQKYIGARDDHKGLYGDCRIPELALCPGQALGPPAATHGNASAHHGDNVLSSQITPWSQPATIDSPRHWSEPLATPKPQQVQPVPPGQQQQYVQIVPAEQSCESTYPTTHQPQHSWPEPEASSQQPQWAQSTTTLAPHNYAEQIYWAPQVDHTNQLVPSAPNLGQHSYSSLEVSSQYSDGHASSWTHGTDTGPTLAGSLEVPLMKTNMKTNPSKRYITGSYESRKLMWWILGILMGMLIVIGAVVGGVLGSRAAHVQTESDTPITLGSNSTTTLETIRQNSRLAVTGYRGDNGNYTLRLFFQDPENRIRFMDKSSVGGKWTDPVTLDTLDFEPMPNGSITASSYLGSDPVSAYVYMIRAKTPNDFF